MPAVSALAAITRGLASTARAITCAALIMVAVVSGFMFGQDPLAKMMGLGLATAIAIDATIGTDPAENDQRRTLSRQLAVLSVHIPFRDSQRR